MSKKKTKTALGIPWKDIPFPKRPATAGQGAKPFQGGAFFDSLVDDLTFRFHKRNAAITVTRSTFVAYAFFQTPRKKLFSIVYALDNTVLLSYSDLENGKLVERHMAVDPDKDDWHSIISVCELAIRFYESGSAKVNEIQDPLLDGLLELLEPRYKCEVRRPTADSTKVFEASQGVQLFQIIGNGARKVFAYFAVERKGRRMLAVPAGNLKLAEAWKLLKPILRYCDCKKKGIPYREDMIDRPFATLLDETIYLDSLDMIDGCKNLDFLAGPYLKVIIPFLRSDGALYYPEELLECKYNWENGRYYLPLVELADLLEHGRPAVKIYGRETKKKKDLRWDDESPLMKEGYSVASNSDGSPVVSDSMRRVILSRIIDHKVLTAKEVASYLHTFYSKRQGTNMENAKRRWLADFSFVVNKYNVHLPSNQGANKRPKKKKK